MSDLLVGLIGIGGALVGALVGGMVNFIVMRRQIRLTLESAHESEDRRRREAAIRSVTSEIEFLLKVSDPPIIGWSMVEFSLDAWDSYHSEFAGFSPDVYDDLQDGYSWLRRANSVRQNDPYHSALGRGVFDEDYKRCATEGIARLHSALLGLQRLNPEPDSDTLA